MIWDALRSILQLSILTLKIIIYNIFIIGSNDKLCNLWHSIMAAFPITEMLKGRILTKNFI